MEHPSPIIDIDDLRQARDRLLHEGVQHYQEASSPVREPILRSWRRSVSEAVPTGRNAFRYLDPQGRSEPLRRSASPVLDRLQTDLDGLGVAIFLSDHQGLILSRRAGSAAQRNTLDNACAAEGFDFSEPAVGTNAIGTVLEEKSAHFVQGGEHFNDALEQLTCAGAPIRLAHTGQVVGSIALTCATADSNPMMLSLAVNAARQVEQIMADLDGGRNRALFAALAPRSGSARRIPIAVLTSDAVLSDTAALQFVTPEHYPLLWEAVTSRSWGAKPQTIELDLPDGPAIAVAHRITDSTGDAFRLEFQYGTRPPRGRRRDERTPTASLHPVPAISERLRYVLQVCTTVAIDGAAGTGKDHVARQMVALAPQRPVRRLDLSTAGRLGDGWFAEAADVLSAGGDVILRHLEDLDADQVHRVTALARLGSDSAGEPGPGSGRLILLVHLESAPEHVKDLVRQTATGVSLPGLASMKEHIPDLAQTILSGMPGITPGTTLSSAARRALTAYPWPGNVRQLRQAMVDVAATRPGWLILLDHLPPWLRGAGQGRRLTGYERAERQAIVAALQEAHGNRSKAAALLGIGRTTLYRKIRSLRIDCPDDAPATPAVEQ